MKVDTNGLASALDKMREELPSDIEDNVDHRAAYLCMASQCLRQIEGLEAENISLKERFGGRCETCKWWSYQTAACDQLGNTTNRKFYCSSWEAKP